MEYLELVENLYSFLVVKEQQYRQELHDARKECINVRFRLFLFCHAAITL